MTIIRQEDQLDSTRFTSSVDTPAAADTLSRRLFGHAMAPSARRWHASPTHDRGGTMDPASASLEVLMEDTRFDDATKSFNSLTSRRLTLGALLGGALSALRLSPTLPLPPPRASTSAVSASNASGRRARRSRDVVAD